MSQVFPQNFMASFKTNQNKIVTQNIFQTTFKMKKTKKAEKEKSCILKQLCHGFNNNKCSDDKIYFTEVCKQRTCDSATSTSASYVAEGWGWGFFSTTTVSSMSASDVAGGEGWGGFFFTSWILLHHHSHHSIAHHQEIRPTIVAMIQERNCLCMLSHRLVGWPPLRHQPFQWGCVSDEKRWEGFIGLYAACDEKQQMFSNPDTRMQDNSHFSHRHQLCYYFLPRMMCVATPSATLRVAKPSRRLSDSSVTGFPPHAMHPMSLTNNPE